MNTYLLAGSFMAAIVVVLIAMALYGRQANRHRCQRLDPVAEGNGWELLPNPPFDARLAFWINGREGETQWEVKGEKYSPFKQRRSLPARLTWQCPDLALAAETMFLGPSPVRMPPRFEISRGINRIAWGFWLAAFGINDVTGLSSQSLASPLFQERYMVFARSQEMALRFITNEVESQLLNWPQSGNPLESPFISVDAGGLCIRVHSDRFDDESTRLEQLVSLGAAFIKAASANN